MVIVTAEQYQDALQLIEQLNDKGPSSLELSEKQLLTNTLRAVELYQFTNDPLSLIPPVELVHN